MWSWASENGGPCISVWLDGVAEGEDGYGLRGLGVTRRFSAGDTVLRIPASLLFYRGSPHLCGVDGGGEDAAMTVRQWKSAAARAACAAPADVVEVDDETAEVLTLALLLAQEAERGEQSFFAPWIATLPRKSHALVDWTEHERDVLLSGSMHGLFGMARRMRSLADSLRAYADVHRARWEWAIAQVWSRSFLVDDLAVGDDSPVDYERRALPVMAPVIDLCNFYVLPREILGASSSQRALTAHGVLEAFEVTTLVDLAPGQPVNLHYGDRTNGQLLGSYGFTAAANPFEALHARIPPELTSDNSLADAARTAARLRAAGWLDPSARWPRYYFTLAYACPVALLNVLRLIADDEETWDMLPRPASALGAEHWAANAQDLAEAALVLLLRCLDVWLDVANDHLAELDAAAAAADLDPARVELARSTALSARQLLRANVAMAEALLACIEATGHWPQPSLSSCGPHMALMSRGDLVLILFEELPPASLALFEAACRKCASLRWSDEPPADDKCIVALRILREDASYDDVPSIVFVASDDCYPLP